MMRRKCTNTMNTGRPCRWLALTALVLGALSGCNSPVATISPAGPSPKQDSVALTAGGGQGATARYTVRLMIGAALPVGRSADGRGQLGPGATQHGQDGPQNGGAK
ncbi:MAG: hypothetical protein VB934_04045 [Polyangiaceae bacterium]